MRAIYILSGQGNFEQIRNWTDYEKEVKTYCEAQNKKTDKEISISSWRKYKRIISKTIRNSIFGNIASSKDKEIRLRDAIAKISKNDVYVIDIASILFFED